MSSHPSQDPYSQTGYDDGVPEAQMTQEELEEAKDSYRAGLQQRIGQLEKELSDRKHGKDKKNGKKSHGGSSSKSSKKSSRHKSSSSGSAMPTYPVGYDPTATGAGQSSASSSYQDSSGQQWVWSSSQGWVPVQDQQGTSQS